MLTFAASTVLLPCGFQKEHAIAVEELEKSQAEHRWQKEPQEPNDFERLILIHGNAAAVWIRYCVFDSK